MPVPSTRDETYRSAPPGVVNVAGYLFIPLDRLPQRRGELRELCGRLQLRGTILLAPEGINLFLAGTRDAVDELLAALRDDPALAALSVKESLSDEQPFERMLVKIKSEIIAFSRPGIDPLAQPTNKIGARELRELLDRGADLTLLDVRNNYEVRVGTFAGAVPVDIDHFRDFPEAAAQLPEDLRRKPVVMFCTGGIRCEKAGPYLEQAGFENVRQLDGGILKYFEEVGGDHYRGECFVFDKRVALDPQLRETGTAQCYACLEPLSAADQLSPLYDPPHACPHCHLTAEQKSAQLLARRHAALRAASSPLPGSSPYDNPRPLNVPARFAGKRLDEFLCEFLPHMGEEYWREACREGRIKHRGEPLSAERIVRPGEQLVHLLPGTREPDVSADIAILYEDDDLVAVHKSAPLPVHPCGRFHRNTLQWLLNAAYRPLKLKPAHRLDANTTGVVLLAKTRTISAALRRQFDAGAVEKTYLARVRGCFPIDLHSCEAAISRESVACGGRVVDARGQAARTDFRVLGAFPDGTALLEARPRTGRTNQIRVHLWHLGYPIVGDRLYLPGGKMGTEQTIEPGAEMCLHAWKLSLAHPATGERIEFTAPPPKWAEQEQSETAGDESLAKDV